MNDTAQTVRQLRFRYHDTIPTEGIALAEYKIEEALAIAGDMQEPIILDALLLGAPATLRDELAHLLDLAELVDEPWSFSWGRGAAIDEYADHLRHVARRLLSGPR